jgi:hypothetical protein
MASTSLRGRASTAPCRELTVVAMNRELYTASSVASTTAWKRPEVASLASSATERRASSFFRLTRGLVEKAMM